MNFELPKIKIEIFSEEAIVTASGVSGAAQELAAQLSATADGGVNIVSWNMYNE